MISDLPEIYRNKKVFLTGHTGFKGSWLLAWLHSMGAVIKGYALAPENEADLYNVIEGDWLCNSVIADIRNAALLKQEILDFQPDFVFHLAAQPLVRLSYEIPVDTFAINTLGTAHLLDAIRFLDKSCVVVVITTDKVYQNLEKQHYYKEGDRLGGYDPYSASKAAAEIVIESYRNAFFNPDEYSRHGKSISVGRAGNVIGGGDWAKDRIVPDIIRALMANKEIEVRNPAAVRPWQHVLEPLSGYLLLASRQYANPVLFAGAYNFGPYPSDNLTVQEIVQTAIHSWGSGHFTHPVLSGEPHEAGLLQLDINKAIADLNWKPRFEAKEAIQVTLDWYREYMEHPEKMAGFTLEQIHHYSM